MASQHFDNSTYEVILVRRGKALLLNSLLIVRADAFIPWRAAMRVFEKCGIGRPTST